ncbi:MAG: toll/interleukin-1 receptor domain-containing protein, partial [Nannocystaceae bacterium]
MDQSHASKPVGGVDVPKVFFSYSRWDSDFAHSLRERLEATKRVQVLIDKKDVLPSEDWRQRLEGLIRSADKVVFLLSKNSLSSDACAWEANIAE